MSVSHLEIRAEQPGDEIAIARVHTAAFPTSAEANLVAALRINGHATISLVAIVNSRIVGHVLFSPVTVADEPVGLGLAPVAVLPGQQRQGIGHKLITAGLEQCRGAGYPLVVVLGEPAYYARFGFLPATTWNLCDEYHGGDAFQAIVWRNVPSAGGLIQYGPEFAELS